MDLHLSRPSPPPSSGTPSTRAFAGLAHPTVNDDRPMRTPTPATTRGPSGTCCCRCCTRCRTRGLDHPGRAEPHRAHAVRAAGGGIRGGHVLRAVLGRPRAPRVVHVCDDVACGCAARLARAHRRARARGRGGRTRVWVRSPCLGLCERAPAALSPSAGRGAASSQLTRRSTRGPSAALLRRRRAGRRRLAHAARRPASRPLLRLLRRVGARRPGSLDDYRAHGGYAALRRAIDIGPER